MTSADVKGAERLRVDAMVLLSILGTFFLSMLIFFLTGLSAWCIL